MYKVIFGVQIIMYTLKLLLIVTTNFSEKPHNC